MTTVFQQNPNGKRLLTALLFITLSATAALAQTFSLSGAVVDATNKALEAATVSLLRSADSSLVKVELSDAAGRYEFLEIKPGDYRVAVTMLGFEKQFSEVFSLGASVQPVSVPKNTTAGICRRAGRSDRRRTETLHRAALGSADRQRGKQYPRQRQQRPGRAGALAGRNCRPE